MINRFKVGKHFRTDIKEESFHFDRKKEQIEREAALDVVPLQERRLTGIFSRPS